MCGGYIKRMAGCGVKTTRSPDGFKSRGVSPWGLGYGGDSWAELEMGFAGTSAFQGRRSLHRRPERFAGPVASVRDYGFFAAEDGREDMRNEYESYDDVFDQGGRYMHAAGDMRCPPAEMRAQPQLFGKTLFSPERGLNGVGYMPRAGGAATGDSSMARQQQRDLGAARAPRWVFDPTTRRWVRG